MTTYKTTYTGKLAYVKETEVAAESRKGRVSCDAHTYVSMYVQQDNGDWWHYGYKKGEKAGTPLRGRDRQARLSREVEELKKEC